MNDKHYTLEAHHLEWLITTTMREVQLWHQDRSRVGNGIRFDNPEVVMQVNNALTDAGLMLDTREYAESDVAHGVLYHELPDPYKPLGVARFIEPHDDNHVPEGIKHRLAALWHERAEELYFGLDGLPLEFVLDNLKMAKAASEAHALSIDATDACRVIHRHRMPKDGNDYANLKRWHNSMSNLHTKLGNFLLAEASF